VSQATIHIKEKFTVDAPPADVYAVLSDPYLVVDCVQGAGLGETHEDGSMDGTMTVKFSAMRVVFRGRFNLDLEPELRRGTLIANGRDGQGGTKFSATASFEVDGPADSATSVVTTSGAVVLSGRIASVIESAAGAVVRRLTSEFIHALSRRCASDSALLGPSVETPLDQAVADNHPAPPVVGVVLLHGFGGSPRDLRAWGEALAEAGMAVAIPRLPGHGTRWKDLERTGFDDWLSAADAAVSTAYAEHGAVYVMGLSLGALLALRLAELRPSAVAGLVLVNPLVSVVSGTPRPLPLARVFRRSARVKAPNDIKQPRRSAVAYDRIPLRAAASAQKAGNVVLAELPGVKQPVLLVTSSEDHVVAPTDGERVAAGLTGAEVTRIRFADSYHFVPLDNDGPKLFQESIAFITTRRREPSDIDQETIGTLSRSQRG
jgi:carboxylesterase